MSEITRTFMADCYVVIHDGTKCTSYGEIKVSTDQNGNPRGVLVRSGQPFMEDFLVEQDAIDRATELGWVFPEEAPE